MSNCPNCGSNVNQGEAFCRVCGTKMPVPQTDFFNNTQQFQQGANQFQNYQQPQNNFMPQNNMINDNDLIDSYIGKNADKLKNGGFSANTFFFGFIYVLYRKMWLLGFLWLAISFVVSMFLGSIYGLIGPTANIIISIQFKKFYLKHVEEQVDKIKAENPGKTKEQLMKICSQKGGTALAPVIVAIIFYTISISIIVLAALGVVMSKEKGNVQGTNESGTIGNLNVTIPSNLVASSHSTDDYKIYRTDYNNDDSCSLKLSKTKSRYYNNDAKKYLEKNIYYSTTDTYSGISPKIVNNISWYYATVTSSNNQKYYYSITNNGTIYTVEFDITDDTNKTCSSAYNTVINSLKFN